MPGMTVKDRWPAKQAERKGRTKAGLINCASQDGFIRRITELRRIERRPGAQACSGRGAAVPILTREERLNVVASDIVKHFLDRGFQGKAMVISIDKATALRMYDKVRAHWDRELEQTKRALEEALVRSHQQRTREVIELEERKATLETTDMARIHQR